MSYLKFISGLLLISLFEIGCKPATVVKNKEQEAEPKDTINLDVAVSGPAESVYVSKDSGYTWKPFDNKLPGNLQANHIKLLGDELILSTKGNGLFLSQNHRTSWKDISTGLATKEINTIYVHGNELYIGLFHEGVTRWQLGSSYWESFNSNLPNRNVTAIVKYKNELLAGTEAGLFKSSNKMQTWNGKHLGEQIVSLIVKGDTILAGTPKGVLISLDGGEKWRYANKFGPLYAFTILDNYVYAQYTSGDLYMSDNGGRSWREINYSSKDHSPVLAMIKAGDHYLLGTHQGLFTSTNGKTGWKSIPQQEQLTFIDFTMKDGVLYGVVSRQ